MRRTKKTSVKRITSVFLSAVMLLSSVQSVFATSAESFTDFPTGWSKPAMEAAVDNGLLSGFGNNEIRPKNNLTRAEIAVIMSRAFGATTTADISAFNDVSYGAWYYEYIAKAVQMGALSGRSATEMYPNENVTREEAFSIIGRILVLSDNDTSILSKFKDVENVSPWAAGNIAALVRRGYVNGDALGYLNPKANITREEFAQVMYTTIKKYITEPGTYSEDMQGIVVLRTGNVTLSNMAVAGDLVVGDGAMNLAVIINNVAVSGRLLTRGGTITIKNSTVSDGVVVYNPNGITAFNNYSTEGVFNGITTITKASFLSVSPVQPGGGGSSGGGGGGGGGGDSTSTQYYVTFKLNASDTANYARFKVTKGSTIGRKMPAAPTKPGYTFAGWYDTDGHEVTANTRVTGTLSVTARWTLNEYELVLDAQFREGASPRVLTYTIENYRTIVLPNETEVVIPSGMSSFLGWYKEDGTRVTALDESFITATVGRITLEARFENETPPVQTYYSVVYKLSAGDEGNVGEYSVLEGTAIGSNMPDVPTKLGYTFVGWYDANENRITSATVVTSDITAVAKWTLNEYELVLEGPFSNGQSSKTIVYTVEDYLSIVLPGEGELTVPEGMESFIGWYTSADERVISLDHTFITDVPGTITLTAKFTPQRTITVSFYNGYGEEMLLDTVNYELVEGVARIDTVPTYPAGTDVFRKKTYVKTDYPDYNGVYRVTPTFWYEVSGKLVPFKAPVELTSDTNVYLMYQNVALNASITGLPDVAISSKYNEDARLIDSVKVLSNGVVNWLNLAKMYPQYTDVVDTGIGALVDRDIMDENRNLKMLYMPVKISQLTTKDVANGMVKTQIRNMIADPAGIDIILNNQELTRKLIEEIANNDDFIYAIVNTDQFKNYVLPLIRKGGAYEDVSTKLLNSDTTKRQILDAVEDSDDFKRLLSTPGDVRDQVLSSITDGVEDGIIKFLFDLEGATDYTDIIGEAKVAEVRAAIENKIIEAVGGQLVYDSMTQEQKYQARVEVYQNPVVYAEIRTSVTAEINAYITYINGNKESILDGFINGTLTDDTLIGMIEDTMIGYVRSYINKEDTLNDSIEAIIEANIINYISDLITGPVPTDTDLAEIKARLDETVDTFIQNVYTNTQLIKDYIETLDDAGRRELADEIYDLIVATSEYQSLMNDMFTKNELTITTDNLAFVQALSQAIADLSADNAFAFADNAFLEKFINLVGKDFIEDKFEETRDAYCAGLDEAIENVRSGASTYEKYTTSLRFKVNPVEDVLVKLYDKAQTTVEEKLRNANVYYDENEYLQYIVNHDVIDRLLTGDGVVNGEFIGYAIKNEVEYAKYMMELLIASDDALCWYGDDANLTEEQVDAIVNAAVAKAQVVHARINGVLEEYMATGDLPEQIEQLLTKVQKINDLFLRVEPKLRTIIERYLASGINDKIQNGNIVENEKVQTGFDILLGREDPVFTIDCLYDIFDKYDDKVQQKLKQLVDSGKLRAAIDKAFDKAESTDAITNKVDAEKLEKLEEFADQLYAVLVNIANNGIDEYKVNTDNNPTIIDQYHLTIGENEFTMTRSLQ